MLEGIWFLVLVLVVCICKGEFVDLFDKFNVQGYSWVWVDGVVYLLIDLLKLKKQEKYDIEVVVDCFIVKVVVKWWFIDLVEIVLNLVDGIVVFEFVDYELGVLYCEQWFFEKLVCFNGYVLVVDDLELWLFLFNLFYGVCFECSGLGICKEVDLELVVFDLDCILVQGVVVLWLNGYIVEYFIWMMVGFGEVFGFDVDMFWCKLLVKVCKVILEGVDEQVYVCYCNCYGCIWLYYVDFEGVLVFL